MARHNPYAPSAASMKQSRSSGVVADEAQVWRDGSAVVMNLSASMPRRCIRCNEPAADPTRGRKVYWHHPAIYIFLIGYLLVYAKKIDSDVVRLGGCKQAFLESLPEYPGS
jgi:hypothetical protein